MFGTFLQTVAIYLDNFLINKLKNALAGSVPDGTYNM